MEGTNSTPSSSLKRPSSSLNKNNKSDEVTVSSSERVYLDNGAKIKRIILAKKVDKKLNEEQKVFTTKKVLKIINKVKSTDDFSSAEEKIQLHEIKQEDSCKNVDDKSVLLNLIRPVCSIPGTDHTYNPSSNPSLNSWQSSKFSVKERLAFLFNNSEFADITFIVGPEGQQEEFPAHKLVLAASSTFFANMLYKNLTAGNVRMILPNAEPRAFLEFLRYLYTDDVSISMDNVMAVLHFAQQFDVHGLRNIGTSFFKDNLSLENVFMFLTQAKQSSLHAVISACHRFIYRNTAEAILEKGYLDIDLSTLCSLLKSNYLNASEIQLFDAVCRWSEAECGRQGLPVIPGNQQRVLGEAVSLVRFPLMSIEDFSAKVSLSGLLLEKDVIDMFRFLISTKNPKPSINFDSSPRTPVTAAEHYAFRFSKIHYGWTHHGVPDKLGFTVNLDVELTGFKLFSSKSKDKNYLITVKLIEKSTSIIYKESFTHWSSGEDTVFPVHLKQPVRLTAFVDYTCIITTLGPYSYFGTSGVKRSLVTLDYGDIVTVTYNSVEDDMQNSTTEDRGQIAGILFTYT